MNILITGSKGFIGKNFHKNLLSQTSHKVFEFTRESNIYELDELITKIDIVFHFAGINKIRKNESFDKFNVELTKRICSILKKNPVTQLYYASSTQANLDNDYGKSKKKGEQICLKLNQEFPNKVFILRLPGIYGEGCKPNYNSVVATFCFNIANDYDIQLFNIKKELQLVYIDDLCKQLINLINKNNPVNNTFVEIKNSSKISVEDLFNLIKGFKNKKNNIQNIKEMKEFEKKLFLTYLSYKK